MPLRRGHHMKKIEEFSQKLYPYIKYIVYIQYSITYIILCATDGDIYTLFLISISFILSLSSWRLHILYYWDLHYFHLVLSIYSTVCIFHSLHHNLQFNFGSDLAYRARMLTGSLRHPLRRRPPFHVWYVLRPPCILPPLTKKLKKVRVISY